VRGKAFCSGVGEGSFGGEGAIAGVAVGTGVEVGCGGAGVGDKVGEVTLVEVGSFCGAGAITGVAVGSGVEVGCGGAGVGDKAGEVTLVKAGSFCGEGAITGVAVGSGVEVGCGGMEVGDKAGEETLVEAGGVCSGWAQPLNSSISSAKSKIRRLTLRIIELLPMLWYACPPVWPFLRREGKEFLLTLTVQRPSKANLGPVEQLAGLLLGALCLPGYLSLVDATVIGLHHDGGESFRLQ